MRPDLPDLKLDKLGGSKAKGEKVPKKAKGSRERQEGSNRQKGSRVSSNSGDRAQDLCTSSGSQQDVEDSDDRSSLDSGGGGVCDDGEERLDRERVGDAVDGDDALTKDHHDDDCSTGNYQMFEENNSDYISPA